MQKILIRFDDICPTMDFDQFEWALSELDRFGIKPLIGVVPSCTDPELSITETRKDFWDYLKKLQDNGISIAMHGYHHDFDIQCRGNVVRRTDSEFAGHSLEDQCEKIRKGKEILSNHDIQTDVFFAPGHSYDTNTIRALAINGFRYMSDGKSRKPYTRFGIKLLPCRSGGIPRRVPGPLQTAVFHINEWNRKGSLMMRDEFMSFLQQHHDKLVSWTQYSSSPKGCSFFQLLIETIYVFCERNIFPKIINKKK